MRSDLIIRHAQVIDGSGSPRFRADVAVEGDRIRAIGDLGASEAEVTIDGTGCILAPGLIDVHTHMTYYWDQKPGTRPWAQLLERMPASRPASSA